MHPLDEINAQITEALHSENHGKWASLVKQRCFLKRVMEASESGIVEPELEKPVNFCRKYIQFHTDKHTDLSALCEVWKRAFWHILNDSKEYQNGRVPV